MAEGAGAKLGIKAVKELQEQVAKILAALEPKLKTKAVVAKEKRVKTEFNKLKKLCNGLGANKLAVAMPLIEQAAFMRTTLADLQAEINEAGCVEEYRNGREQSGYKVTAALQAYNSTVKNYAAVCERLDRILPASSAGSKLAALMADD